MPERVEIVVDGRPAEAEADATVLAALWNLGRAELRKSVSGEPRGALCAMGVCQECRVTLDGAPDRRACLEPLRPGLDVRTGTAGPATALPRRGVVAAEGERALETDVLVVGLGPAGLAAAVAAAEAGARVVVVDEGTTPGGQIWRHRPAAHAGLPRTARSWLARLDRLPPGSCRVLTGATVIDGGSAGPSAPLWFVVSASAGPRLRIEARATVLATGARELFLPFPGWTLPGVVGVGAAQALVKSGASVEGRLVVVAGSGPLLLPVAATLARAGARIVAVAEQAPGRRVAGFATGLLAQPSKLLAAAGYRWAFAAAPYRTGTFVASAHGGATGGVERVTLDHGGRRVDLRCDLLACAYGLVPNLELPRLLGCALEPGGQGLAVDDSQRTSVSGVFAAGEVCGVAGVEVGLVEGEIAGAGAARRPPAAHLKAARAQGRAFGLRLRAAFALRSELRALAAADTLVCRCEDVALGRVRPEWAPRQAKLYTRAGMGACQGRVCGSAFEFLFGWPPDTVRPPLVPTPFDALKEAEP